MTVVVFALMATASAAFADHEPQDEDSILNIGVDEDNGIVAVNFGDNDTPWVCDFYNSDNPLWATYGELVDGQGEVEALQLGEGGDPVEFEAREEHFVNDEFYTAEEGTIEYSGADGECAVNYSLWLANPEGKRNHGQFLKAAKSLLNIKGAGCVVREFAKMDYGKGYTDSMREPDAVATEPAAEGELSFSESIEVDCTKPNEKPEKGERGKSADAPGKNKGD